MPMRDLPHLAAVLFDTPHLIRRGKLDTILNVVAPRLMGGTLPARPPFGAWDDDDDADESSPAEAYTVRRGVAVISVVGTLVRRGSWLDAASNLMSYSGLKECVREAMVDPDVRAVLFDLDSHGGEAGGCFDLVEAIRAMAARYGKPVWAAVNENASSAAYAIACSASEIWITRTGEAGSIGVVCAHLDVSEADKKAGLKWTFIFEGEHKVAGNPHAPLDDETRATLQADVRDLYEMFVDLVAQHRGMTTEKVRDTKADTFRGKKAVEVGLADRVGTLEQALAALVRSVDKTLSGLQPDGESQMRTRQCPSSSRAFRPAAASPLRKSRKSLRTTPPTRAPKAKTKT